MYAPGRRTRQCPRVRRSEQVLALKTVKGRTSFSLLANSSWLLVEGMYLQTLLALTFISQRKYFRWYVLIGWVYDSSQSPRVIPFPEDTMKVFSGDEEENALRDEMR
ncbi:hypothetical protein NHX12_004745 [Muraenolepis orangiensis]|uniref:Uncharacterized protein n=1 Tax=Muraenolepis orangiensis TaxID=630683 RepID=A0A9Q0DXC4_9TELE|nr:hypothetical protein NHX12_004745 [Muraenolepis orangiensis]